MSTISLRVSDEENKLIQNYVSANNLNLSSFIRNLVLDKIEEDMKMDEDRILRARALMENGLKIELWIKIRPLPPLSGSPSTSRGRLPTSQTDFFYKYQTSNYLFPANH